MADQKVNQEEIDKYLEGVNYPATKQDLINHAKEKGATSDVLKTLESLPDVVFKTTDKLTETLNKLLPIDLKKTLDDLL